MCGIWGLLSLEKIEKNFKIPFLYDQFYKIKHRGPDKSIFINDNNYIIGFHRLAIIDKSDKGDQPFNIKYESINEINQNIQTSIFIICNGEIYNHKEIKEMQSVIDINNKYNYEYVSKSDCEVLLPLFLIYKNELNNELNNKEKDSKDELEHIEEGLKNTKENGLKEMINKINGEFAFAIYEIENNLDTNETNYNLWLGRDRFGIRPLFFSMLNDNTIIFGSEMKSICDFNNKVEVFDPRRWSHWYGNNSEKILYSETDLYYSVGNLSMVMNPYLDDVYRIIRQKLVDAVKIRLESEREIGCLLSGGLDSSLISSIAADELKKIGKKLRTFSIGMKDSPDVYYAKIVASHIESIHTNIEIPEEEWLKAIEKVIYITETYDVTTIRATVGQYLISKWIAENTDIKVLLIGDGSDELTGGYLYFHNAPNPHQSHFECKRLLHYIHYFDVLRSDRGIASNGLEARVPFLDYNFVDLYMQIDPTIRTPDYFNLDGENIKFEKYLLRKSFNSTEYLPKCVLWRRKEAFSDGVSSQNNSWYSILQKNIENNISDEYYDKQKDKYKHHIEPQTKEALFYLEIFNKYYINQIQICPYYWMPKWVETKDPSARCLKIYKELENKENIEILIK